MYAGQVHKTSSVSMYARMHGTAGACAVVEDKAEVGHRSHVGPGAVVLAGCVIGNDVDVGANSVITADVPDGTKVEPGSVWYGKPAKKPTVKKPAKKKAASKKKA